MSDQAATPIRTTFRAANFVAAARWGILAVFGFALLYFRYRGLTGLLGGAVGLFAIQAAFAFLVGVRVDEREVKFPRPLFNPVPLLVFGRMKIALPSLDDITAAGQFMGLEVVVLATRGSAIPALFASRAKRLAFFDAVKSHKPDIKIYRAR